MGDARALPLARSFARSLASQSILYARGTNASSRGTMSFLEAVSFIARTTSGSLFNHASRTRPSRNFPVE